MNDPKERVQMRYRPFQHLLCKIRLGEPNVRSLPSGSLRFAVQVPMRRSHTVAPSPRALRDQRGKRASKERGACVGRPLRPPPRLDLNGPGALARKAPARGRRRVRSRSSRRTGEDARGRRAPSLLGPVQGPRRIPTPRSGPPAKVDGLGHVRTPGTLRGSVGTGSLKGV